MQAQSQTNTLSFQIIQNASSFQLATQITQLIKKTLTFKLFRFRSNKSSNEHNYANFCKKRFTRIRYLLQN